MSDYAKANDQSSTREQIGAVSEKQEFSQKVLGEMFKASLGSGNHLSDTSSPKPDRTADEHLPNVSFHGLDLQKWMNNPATEISELAKHENHSEQKLDKGAQPEGKFEKDNSAADAKTVADIMAAKHGYGSDAEKAQIEKILKNYMDKGVGSAADLVNKINEELASRGERTRINFESGQKTSVEGRTPHAAPGFMVPQVELPWDVTRETGRFELVKEPSQESPVHEILEIEGKILHEEPSKVRNHILKPMMKLID